MNRIYFSFFINDFNFQQLKNLPIIDWYFINPHGPYYQDSIPHSPLPSDIDFDYSTYTQKILVNVINDNSKKIKKKRRTYNSSNNLIGTKTMGDLFHVINNQSCISRIVVIDQQSSNGKHIRDRLRIFDIHTSITPYYYNTYQQPFISYIPIMNSFYPFIYYY